MTFLSASRIAALVCVCGFVTVEAQNAPNPPANQPPEARVASNVIEDIEFRGMRRMPLATLRAMLGSKAGATYDEATMRNDVKALWDSGRYDDIRVEKLGGVRGGLIVRFTFIERRL